MRKKPPFSASRSAPKGGFFRIAPPETPGMERCGRSRLFQHRGVLRRRWERQNVECSTNQSSRSCPLMQRYADSQSLHTVALVGKNGSIDWCCIPRFDAPSVFGALLDAEKGGFFRISPPDTPDMQRKQLYLPDTNILITRFLTVDGVGEIIDFMPVKP